MQALGKTKSKVKRQKVKIKNKTLRVVLDCVPDAPRPALCLAKNRGVSEGTSFLIFAF
jgi:hypothetical protein